MSLAAYYLQEISEEDAREVETFVAEHELSKIRSSNPVTAKAFSGQVKQRLRRNRTLNERRRLDPGETVLRSPQALAGGTEAGGEDDETSES